MTGQPSVVEVLREHQRASGSINAPRGGPLGWGGRVWCSCGASPWGDDSTAAVFAQHQADALATAGLLASGPPLAGPTRESEAEHAAMCDREEAHERQVRADELRKAADRLLAGLDENPLLRGLVSINGGAQAMRDYAVESLREDADRIAAGEGA